MRRKSKTLWSAVGLPYTNTNASTNANTNTTTNTNANTNENTNTTGQKEISK